MDTPDDYAAQEFVALIHLEATLIAYCSFAMSLLSQAHAGICTPNNSSRNNPCLLLICNVFAYRLMQEFAALTELKPMNDAALPVNQSLLTVCCVFAWACAGLLCDASAD